MVGPWQNPRTPGAQARVAAGVATECRERRGFWTGKEAQTTESCKPALGSGAQHALRCWEIWVSLELGTIMGAGVGQRLERRLCPARCPGDPAPWSIHGPEHTPAPSHRHH